MSGTVWWITQFISQSMYHTFHVSFPRTAHFRLVRFAPFPAEGKYQRLRVEPSAIYKWTVDATGNLADPNLLSRLPKASYKTLTYPAFVMHHFSDEDSDSETKTLSELWITRSPNLPNCIGTKWIGNEFSEFDLVWLEGAKQVRMSRRCARDSDLQLVSCNL